MKNVSYAVTSGKNIVSVSTDGTVTILSAGTATITATAEESMKIAGDSASYRILVRKVAATVKAVEKTKDAGKEDPELTATVTGTIGKDRLNYTLGRVAGEKAGQYAITVIPGENPNYEVTTVKGVMTIFATDGDEPGPQPPVKKKTSVVVNFAVENGAWNDGTTEKKSMLLEGYEGDILKLSAEQIPGAGENPDKGYKVGNWDAVPRMETAITEPVTYTYRYDAMEILPGDVNEDGMVDGRDPIRLMKYLAGETDPETGEPFEINDKAADLNADNKVDELDLLRLMKMLAGA